MENVYWFIVNELSDGSIYTKLLEGFTQNEAIIEAKQEISKLNSEELEGSFYVTLAKPLPFNNNIPDLETEIHRVSI
jgi:hypothetical protein